ncbi:hypothetical protein LOAG_17236 [Loa loa]|uniref:Uncharacterized protein n=1 Tax=Loa loa TaxID=7209 RepID=A0A1S0UJY1_LOALO|nr:hypothetical protein LOAG_17236 [Loa loa]EJD75678.1 hypothetical protein LOAG_17236 [Loa loa]
MYATYDAMYATEKEKMSGRRYTFIAYPPRLTHNQRYLRISATIGQQTMIFFYPLNTFPVTYSQLNDLSTNRQSNYCSRKRQRVSVVDLDAICITEEPTIHKVILNSEPAIMVLRKEKPKGKTDVNSEMQTKMENKNLPDGNQRM